MNVAGKLRIAIVDDHPLFRQGVVATLNSDSEIEIISEGSCYRDAVRICNDAAPDILLLDLCMDGGGHSAARDISSQHPSVKIIVLTASDDDDDVAKALELGARAYVLKGIGGRELIDTVRAVHGGETYITPTLAARLLSKMQRLLKDDRTPSPDALTPREEEILAGVGQGLTNKEIARLHGISEKTVKHYMTNILQKLQVRNRVEAVLALRSREHEAPVKIRQRRSE